MGFVAVGKRRYRKLKFFGDLLRMEHQGTRKLHVPRGKRLRAWRHGFLGESAALYDLAQNDWRDYLSDYAYYLKTPFINYGRYNALLNDKVFFYYMMKSIAAPTPAVHGFVADNRIAWVDPPSGVAGTTGLDKLLEQEKEIVLKPVDGGGGHGISFITANNGSLRVNGEGRDMRFVQSLLAPGTLISARIHQADYAAKINALATNTIRIVTMLDPQTEEPFIAWAVHRFATQRSLPVDNFGQGSLSANVDFETGRLGPGITFPYAGHIERHSVHPDSGAQIEGTVIPTWSSVRDGILKVAERLPQLPLVGWDVVVVDSGLSIIEGNSYPNPRTVQIHRPLLTDTRVRDFYRHHGVISH